MPALIYSQVVAKAFNKEIDLLDDTIKVMLTTATYSPNQDTHDYKDDVTNEVSGTGYTATGATLANDTLNYTAGSNLWTYDADDVSWASSSFTCRYAVIYDATPGSDATRPLIEYQDFGGDQTVSSGTFTIQWNASGIFTITVS
jgi:hypothetical protein